MDIKRTRLSVRKATELYNEGLPLKSQIGKYKIEMALKSM